ncbi:MAG: hypothetical protein H6760_03390 [Candidatus Nomurabacteria bacterium]|nr:MAG: hypothetical protein H6760_03390 [Candidatus Nomurabacteria bacterium]
MRYLLFLIVALVALSVASPGVSLATDTTVEYSFYGPSGDYKIELFEVGAPYPSRQDYVYGYSGTFTYRRTWSSIVAYRSYFIRITDLNSGVAKQTGSVYVTYNGGYYAWSTCYWSSM